MAGPGTKVERGGMRDASSVILYRREPLEIYLVRRPEQARFFPGHWSLPGGAVDVADGTPGSWEAFRRAAVREVEEELRVAAPPGLDARLVPAGRALTPPFHTIRFNAQYFLMPCPEDWRPDPDPAELAGGGWFAPADALARWQRREMRLPPPILHVVRTLARPGGFDELARLGDGVHAFPNELLPDIRLVPLEVATLPPARHTNAFVLGHRQLAVVDPGAAGAALGPLVDTLDALQKEGARVVMVLLTHHHADHVAGAAEIAQRYRAPLAAHGETVPRLGRGLVTMVLRDGQTLSLDAGTDRELRLEALHTPGHAPGHLAFLVRPHGVLLAGDLVSTMSTILIDPSEGDMGTYMRSLERCVRAAPEIVFPAHGPPDYGGAGLLSRTLEHRRMRERLVLDALTEAPRTMEAILPLAYHDTPPELHALAARSLEAHLRKLQAEGKARKGRDGWSRAQAPSGR